MEKLAREGKIRELPRMGEKHEAEAAQGDRGLPPHRRPLSHRRCGTRMPENHRAIVAKFPGIDKITPAGSLRRGRETVGDLDILVTGKACTMTAGAPGSDRPRREISRH